MALAALTTAGVAQGPPGRDRNNLPPGHGGVPPGQAKKYDNDRGRYDDRGRANFRFRDEDRNHFYTYYRRDADRWRNRRRPAFRPGDRLPVTYRIEPVPRTYWQGMPPPPPGYQYGYYQGYVVAYDPTSRIVGDVLDLVNAAVGR